MLGGGPNLPGDLERIPGDAVLIAVNCHALSLVYVDYLCFCDDPAGWDPELRNVVEGYAGQRLTFVPGWGDWDFDVPFLYGGMAGTFATWCACYMTDGPVLLCGMDCFQSDRVYFYSDPEARHVCQDYPVADHLAAWRVCLSECLEPGRIWAVSGPLVGVFGEHVGAT